MLRFWERCKVPRRCINGETKFTRKAIRGLNELKSLVPCFFYTTTHEVEVTNRKESIPTDKKETLFSSVFQMLEEFPVPNLIRNNMQVGNGEFPKNSCFGDRSRHDCDNIALVDQVAKPYKKSIDIITAAKKSRLAFTPTVKVQKTFVELGLPGWLVESLFSRNIVQPTTMQQRLIEIMTGNVKSRSTIYMKAQTGTGKSLGYVIGLLSGLHREKLPLSVRGNCSCLQLILVPNAILGQQLLRWIRALLGGNSFWAGQLTRVVRVQLPTDELDDHYPEEITQIGSSHILIATSTKVRELLAKGLLNVGAINNIIVDEVDAQLRPLPTFMTRKMIRMRSKHPIPSYVLLKELLSVRKELKIPAPRMIVASATLNRRCRSELAKIGISKKSVMIDNQGTSSNELVTCPATIKHYYRVLKDAESIEELGTLIKSIADSRLNETGVIFMPATKSKAAIQELLFSLGIKNELVSRLKTCSESKEKLEGKMLVGSDLDSRGWDFPLLSYVIILDLPSSPTHYLHMAGRVGRMGNSGTVYTFVAGERDLERLTNIYSQLWLSPIPYVSSCHKAIEGV